MSTLFNFTEATPKKVNIVKWIVNDRKCIEYSYFEGDTIVGKARKSAIVTLVEKYSKYIALLKASRKSKDVKEAICKWLSSLHKSCISTITFDRGKEFSKWSDI